MQHDEFMSLKETGQKGDFLLPYMVCTTVLPDFKHKSNGMMFDFHESLYYIRIS